MNTSSYGSSPVSKAVQNDSPNELPPNELPAGPPQSARPKEIGGREGLEPTRYGDWEKAGRCIDF